MSRIVMKEAPDVDYYVEWTSIAEGWTFAGTRADMLTHLSSDADPWLSPEAPHHPQGGGEPSPLTRAPGPLAGGWTAEPEGGGAPLLATHMRCATCFLPQKGGGRPNETPRRERKVNISKCMGIE